MFMKPVSVRRFNSDEYDKIANIHFQGSSQSVSITS